MNLTAADLAMFQAIGVDPPTVAAFGVERVTHEQAHDKCGLRYKKTSHLEGIAFPFRMPPDGRLVTWVVRRDNPEIDSKGEPIAKYLGPPGSQRLYFGLASAAALTDTTVPVILVESPKSVLAVTASLRKHQGPAIVIATGGCWGWHGVTGKKTNENGKRVDQRGIIPDFDRIVWQGRDTLIAFDGDAAVNQHIHKGRERLAEELHARGAKVRFVDLPIEVGVNGPDDYIGKHGASAFWALVKAAKPAPPPKAKREKTPKQGREVQLDDPEPWPSAVNGAALLGGIMATFTKYLALPAHASLALALWVLHCYAFVAWFTSPFLAITSPTKRCGKTLLLIVLAALVPRRLFASNVTPAVLFRAIERYSPVLLIDEADTFVRDNDELRGVLNSGHTRSTAVVIRTVGDDHDPRVFSTWCAKAIALIGKLPGTLADRAIEIRMQRRAKEQIARLRQDRIEGECADLRRQAARWAADHLVELDHCDPTVPEALNDRAADCWRPLLAIADIIGGEWPKAARQAALALSGNAEDDDEVSTLLLRDIRDIFIEADRQAGTLVDALKSGSLVDQLVALDDRPWAEWSKGRPLSKAKLAWMLRPYGIHPAGTIRFDDETTAKGYRRVAFTDAWDRYLGGLEASQRNKPNNDGPDPAFSNRHNDDGCDGLKSVTNPINTDESDGVTDREGGEEDAVSGSDTETPDEVTRGRRF
jgi:putative DNA primase/helicase